MSKESLSRFLQQTNRISYSVATEISAHFQPRLLSRNQFLLKEHTVADEYFFLHKGCMRAFACRVEGNEVTTAFYTAGQMVFEVASFFNRTRSRENIQALSDCEGWSITYLQLNELFHSLPEFREFGRAMLVKGFVTLKSRMLSTITESAETRYAALLKEVPEIFQHAPLKTIASYLGITDSSLSRIRASFAKQS